jgi:hypothetical protein
MNHVPAERFQSLSIRRLYWGLPNLNCINDLNDLMASCVAFPSLLL